MASTWKRLAGLAAGMVLALTACGGGPAAEPAALPPDSPQLQPLVDAAKAENCLTLYGVPDEAALQAITDEFTARYGIPVAFTRLVSADLSQRFSTEAEAGAPASDVILLTHSPFYASALEQGWLTPMAAADVPALADFPADFLADDGATPIVQLVPSGIVFNPGLVAQPPADWSAYSDPAHRGELLFAEPASSPANLAFWHLMRETYGDEFLREVAANQPRWYNSAVPATQGVAAGEGALGFPGVRAIVRNLEASNAPVEMAVPSPTTGPEIAIGRTAGGGCPNAAKLFANMLLSPEGNALLNDRTGDLSPFAPEAASFGRPAVVSEAEAQEIRTLLGAP